MNKQRKEAYLKKLEEMDLITLGEFAEMIGFEPASKVRIYVNRGLLPEQDLYLGGRPYWFRETVTDYIRYTENKKKRKAEPVK
nr:MAG TPA_asm: Pyocin activator protein PrtN [Caudoviricetes sp.]